MMELPLNVILQNASELALPNATNEEKLKIVQVHVRTRVIYIKIHLISTKTIILTQ